MVLLNVTEKYEFKIASVFMIYFNTLLKISEFKFEWTNLLTTDHL